MAQSTYQSMPLDQPHLQREGVLYAENEAPGNMSHLALPPEHPINRAKGNLGETIMPGFESKALSGPGLPYKLK